MSSLAEAESSNRRRWRWPLLALCAIAAVVLIGDVFDIVGFGGPPWGGWFDGTEGASGQPYVLEFFDPSPNGAVAKAGIRDGDLLDLREQSFDTRVRYLAQPIAGRPTRMLIRRGSKTFVTNLVGSTIYEGQATTKFVSFSFLMFSAVWFFLCALVIAWKRWWLREARYLALAMLAHLGWLILAPGYFIVPNPLLQLALAALSQVCLLFEAVLIVRLSSRFGSRPWWRRVLEWCAYAVNAANVLPMLLIVAGISTLRVDPIGFSYDATWAYLEAVALFLLVPPVLAAILTSPRNERPRAAWLLLPLPLVLSAMATIYVVEAYVTGWVGTVILDTASCLCTLLGGACITYALLRRRVLDFGFVLNRTIVIGSITLLVVTVFVLLEWVISSFFAGANRNATLWIAGGMTLVLGLLMPRFYGWINRVVERVLFAREYRARSQAALLAAGLPYAPTTGAIAGTLTDGVCGALGLPSGAVYRRDDAGEYACETAFGWEETEALSAVDAQRLAMGLEGTRSMVRVADVHLASSALPKGTREPVVAFPLFARQALIGYVLYSAHNNGVDLDPDDLKLLTDICGEASRGYDAVELASRVERAYRAQAHAQREHAETMQRLLDAYVRFVPGEFLRELHKASITDVALGDSVQRTMTVLFSDIRSFTTISEGLSPDQIFAYLNRYLRSAGPIVSEHGGFIDKYIGDAIMGLFPSSADDALGAAIDLHREVRVFNRKLGDGEPPLAIGVGLHTGELMLGTIGERNRMETTVIADAVNAASRLESATKTFGCAIVLSKETKATLREGDRFMLRRLGSLHVKGKNEDLDVYEAFDADEADVIVHKHNTLTQFARSLEAFECGDYATAYRGFSSISAACASDGPAAYYAALSRERELGTARTSIA
ncbi:MAG: adenylate/guanylate cyclase domain-containing protein [Candidatus Eremiobacteraeota bacterium]|nr:adenylate/guanylate cyclase domain-containing protein [Candidatus Eremiobacteraeota bacterium]